MATSANFLTRSLELSNVVLDKYTWMGDRQGRLSAVTLRPFVGVDFKL